MKMYTNKIMFIITFFFVGLQAENKNDLENTIKAVTRITSTQALIDLFSQINHLHTDIVNNTNSINTLNTSVSTLNSEIATLLNSLSITFNDSAHSGNPAGLGYAYVNDVEVAAAGFTIANGSGVSGSFSHGTVTVQVYIIDAIGSSLSAFTGLLIVKAIDSSGVQYRPEGDFTYLPVIGGSVSSTSLNNSGTANTVAGTIQMTHGVIYLNS